MTKKTRYFMAGSAAVLAAGLGTGLVAYYGGGFQPVSASAVPNELSYVPADATVVAYADVRAIMDSELRAAPQRGAADARAGAEGIPGSRPASTSSATSTTSSRRWPTDAGAGQTGWSSPAAVQRHPARRPRRAARRRRSRTTRASAWSWRRTAHTGRPRRTDRNRPHRPGLPRARARRHRRRRGRQDAPSTRS